MKYMVMECHPAYAVVLCEDGRFLKVANLRYEVGQTLTQVMEVIQPQPDPAPAKQSRRRWLPAIASAAACLTLIFGGWFLNFAPYASVYMAINPEVRIDVSRTDRVLDVTGVNADGEALLSGFERKETDLDLVVDELVDRAIDMGYLHEGGKVVLTLDAEERWVTTHETELNDHLAEHLVDKLSVTIDITTPGQAAAPVESTSAGQTMVIPLGPESDYGDSSYGEVPSQDSGYDDQPVSPDSAYEDPRQDGETDYEMPEPGSGYDAPEVTNYDVPDPASSYDAPEHDSGYDAPDPDSGYHEPESHSGYGEPEDGSDYEDD